MRLLILLLCTLAAISQADAQSDYASLKKQYEVSEKPLATFTDLLQAQPANPWVLHFHGLSADSAGLVEEAHRSFEKANSLDPGQAWHLQALGDHWYSRLDFARAATSYRRAAQLETGNADFARSLKERADAAADRAGRRETQRAESESSKTRILVTGVLGFVFIIFLYVRLPRLIDRLPRALGV